MQIRNGFYQIFFVSVLSTVMVRFSARGAYLLLVPQGRALIRERALFSLLRNNRMLKTKLKYFLKTKQ